MRARLPASAQRHADAPLEQAGRSGLGGIAVESFTIQLRGLDSEQHLARLAGAGAARKVTSLIG